MSVSPASRTPRGEQPPPAPRFFPSGLKLRGLEQAIEAFLGLRNGGSTAKERDEIMLAPFLAVVDAWREVAASLGHFRNWDFTATQGVTDAGESLQALAAQWGWMPLLGPPEEREPYLQECRTRFQRDCADPLDNVVLAYDAGRCTMPVPLVVKEAAAQLRRAGRTDTPAMSPEEARDAYHQVKRRFETTPLYGTAIAVITADAGDKLARAAGAIRNALKEAENELLDRCTAPSESAADLRTVSDLVGYIGAAQSCSQAEFEDRLWLAFETGEWGSRLRRVLSRGGPFEGGWEHGKAVGRVAAWHSLPGQANRPFDSKRVFVEEELAAGLALDLDEFTEKLVAVYISLSDLPPLPTMSPGMAQPPSRACDLEADPLARDSSPDGSIIHSPVPRPGETDSSAPQTSYLGLVLDEDRLTLSRGDRSVDCRGGLNIAIIKRLLKSAEVFSSLDVLRGVWDEDDRNPDDKTIYNRMSAVKRLIKPLGVTTENVPNTGYRLLEMTVGTHPGRVRERNRKKTGK